ncbi:alanine--tRNA ligase [Candidatus Uhrbacteria bacterium]|nr:alanine--tRNA ligase [Candidatus Uhrbacteria bacterium]
MTSSDIRKEFLAFFTERGHAIVPSSSLLPDDPSVLLTTAGMQQFKKYYTGEADALKDFGSLSAASCQKSFRTSDIEEVGDESHLTFFEMLGNFSFGGYFKKESIAWAHEFITKVIGVPISYVTIFEGSATVPKDEESRKIWHNLGVTDIREEGMDDVFWGPTGTSGPCGPTTEIYCRNAQGNDIEIWNIVFNQFFCDGSREALMSGDAHLAPLETSGIDTGMGLERLAMISQQTRTIFETDLFSNSVDALPASMDARSKRIVADHARGMCFLISDGVRPSNKERGYILRRLMRRIIVMEHGAGDQRINLVKDIIPLIVGQYHSVYPDLHIDVIFDEWDKEKAKFLKTLKNGLKELEKISVIDDAAAFKLYESYGLPYEIIKEMGGRRAAHLGHAGFQEEFRKHQEISRAGVEKKFGGHGLLLDTGELKASDERELAVVTRLHTATHLLQQALRDVLGGEVKQAGSDITAERARFDFSFHRKVTPDELRSVEERVNEVVAQDLPMRFIEIPLEEAQKTGALFFFHEKYPEKVKVYFAGNTLDEAYSKEFCGGPHVTHTGQIGRVTIIKEEACSAGVRRIRAVVSAPIDGQAV